MLPTPDQIAVAAYHRWERRRHDHGRHADDWITSERELAFGLNYEVAARYRLDGVEPRHLGDRVGPRCRFCERTALRATFDGPRLAVPASMGNESLLTVEECDECHAQFVESVGTDLDRFVASIRRGEERSRSYVPVAAFKGLVKAALVLLPESDLESFEATVEWVSNPDHDLDSGSIGPMDCHVHTLAEPSPFSWAALARRVDDDMPFPYLLAFFGAGHHVFQVAPPLCVRDEDLDGAWEVPSVASPFGVGRGPLDSRLAVIAMAPPAASRRPGRMSFLNR